MTYYNRSDLPFYYALADAYTICDANYCSVMGPTFPNRIYLFTGMIDPNGTGGGPVTRQYGADQRVFVDDLSRTVAGGGYHLEGLSPDR